MKTRLLLMLAGVGVLSTAAIAATTYEYDALGRVTKATYDDGSNVQYQYDALGNRTTVTAATATSPPPPPPPPPPACVGGQIVNGVCLRQSEIDQSCTQACASHGSCNLTLTRALGSDASNNAACYAAADAFLSIDNSNSYTQFTSASGCEFGVLGGDNWMAWFGTTTPTTCEATPYFSNKRRVCACSGDN